MDRTESPCVVVGIGIGVGLREPGLGPEGGCQHYVQVTPVCVVDVHVHVDALDVVRCARDVKGEVHPSLVIWYRGVEVPPEQRTGAHLLWHVAPVLCEGDGRACVDDTETVLVGDQVTGPVLVP